MRISGIQNKICFQRSMTSGELKEQERVRTQALDIVGQDGKSVFIVHSDALPQSPGKNTGVGTLSSKESLDFFKYMKDYIGFNTVEVLPAGSLSRCHDTYIAYAGEALPLGNNQINPELLTHDEFNNILTQNEFEEIVKHNTWEHKDTLVNYENIVENECAQEKALRKAHKRFQALGVETKLKKDYTAYVNQNNDWLEPKGVFEVLKKQNNFQWFRNWDDELDQNLYSTYHDADLKQARIKEILANNNEEIEFVKFKQFIAEEHLRIGKEQMNKMGLKLIGDMQIGFDDFEVFTNPKAFLKNSSVGWGLPALDYTTIKDSNSASSKLLKRKTELFARRYDGIRFDVAWAYLAPKIDGKSFEIGDDSVLKMIEDTVKSVKGKDFDMSNLLYEFEAGPDDFSPYLNEKLRPEMENRTKVFSQDHLSSDWGSLENFKKRGWKSESLLLGVGNHDPLPLRQLAEARDPLRNLTEEALKARKIIQAKVLAKLLNLNESKLLNNPVEFAKAKFALPLTGKHYMAFYMDVFGRNECFNKHDPFHDYQCFRNKIPADYQQQYHKSLQEGFGFNIMDALEKVFVAKELDKKHPTLYAEIVKYRNILLEPETAINKIIETSTETGVDTVKKTSSNRYLKPVLIGLAALAGTGATIFGYRKYSANKITEETPPLPTQPSQVMTPAPLTLKNKFINA